MSTNFFGYIKRMFESIAFIPTIIALAFGLLPFLLISLPHDILKDTSLAIFHITNASNIRTILSFVIGGMFTLTIFSYTMVMNVLNRSINNYSPRLIPLLLEQPHHQTILGVTCGTIIYALILAVLISTDATLDFPELATSLAIFFTIICVFLYIYFIHAVSQSIHINYILKKSFHNTRKNIGSLLEKDSHFQYVKEELPNFDYPILNEECGYFNGLRMKQLAKLANKHNFQVKIEALRGDFITEGEAYLFLSREMNGRVLQKIKQCFNIDHDEPLEVVEVGFKHLVEVAVKASSPSINDPGTAISCIDYLTQLFIKYLAVSPFNAYSLTNEIQFYTNYLSVNKLLNYCFLEMHTYMKDDLILVEKLSKALTKISLYDKENRLEETIIKIGKKHQLSA